MSDRQPHPHIYIDRWQKKDLRQAKIDIGPFVANSLIKGNSKVFVSGGTTAAIAAVEILLKHPYVKVMTHSIPVAWHAMEFRQLGFLDWRSQVEIVGGNLDDATGFIEHDALGKRTSEIFIYAPRSLSEAGISALHNKTAIEEAWKAHKRVILLATYHRLLDGGGQIIKHIGKIKQASRDNNRICELVIPVSTPSGFDKKDLAEAQAVLAKFEKNDVKIHRAPHCKKSKWYRYFKGGVKK